MKMWLKFTALNSFAACKNALCSKPCKEIQILTDKKHFSSQCPPPCLLKGAGMVTEAAHRPKVSQHTPSCPADDPVLSLTLQVLQPNSSAFAPNDFRVEARFDCFQAMPLVYFQLAIVTFPQPVTRSNSASSKVPNC